MTVLKEVKREQAENRIRAGKAWENEWDLVFTNEIGKYMVQQTVWTNFNRSLVKHAHYTLSAAYPFLK